MRYTLLDCPTVQRNLPKMLGTSDEERYMVHEKITVHLRSSLQTIRKYFENVFYIPIFIYCKEEIVGTGTPPYTFSRFLMKKKTNLFSGRAFFKISSVLPDSKDLKEFLLLTRDDTYVAINESFIYPTKTASTFIDEEHRPKLKFNLTIKYHPPTDNQLTRRQQSQENDDNADHDRIYCSSENLLSDADDDTDHPGDETKVLKNDDGKEPLSDRNPSSQEESVECSIQRRNLFIQKLLDTQMDPPATSAKPMDAIRFVDVTSSPPKSHPQPHNSHSQPKAHVDHSRLNQQPQTHHERFDETRSPKKIRKDVAVPSVEHIRSPKSVSFDPELHRELETENETLEKWKRKERETFLAELKRKESEHLKSVAGEWLQRQNKEEEKLEARMKKCKLLTEALEQSLSAIKVLFILTFYRCPLIVHPPFCKSLDAQNIESNDLHM